MGKFPDSPEALLGSAVDYAAEILEGFDEGQGPLHVAVMLDALADEYDLARQQRRGMDPALVRMVVQRLIDAATFHPDNSPETYDPDQPGGTMPLDAPLFRYVRQRGRPENQDEYFCSWVKELREIHLFGHSDPVFPRITEHFVSANTSGTAHRLIVSRWTTTPLPVVRNAAP